MVGVAEPQTQLGPGLRRVELVPAIRFRPRHIAGRAPDSIFGLEELSDNLGGHKPGGTRNEGFGDRQVPDLGGEPLEILGCRPGVEQHDRLVGLDPA